VGKHPTWKLTLSPLPLLSLSKVPMNGENQRLVTIEMVVVEITCGNSRLQDQSTDHFRRIYGMYPKFIQKIKGSQFVIGHLCPKIHLLDIVGTPVMLGTLLMPPSYMTLAQKIVKK
jgi:hypothetical protein